MSVREVAQSIRIHAPPGRVWDALVHPDAGDRWRNARFATDWRPGSPIAIEALIGTRRYRDKGRVLRAEPHVALEYTYWSRVSGLPDEPASYSTIAMALAADGDDTVLTVTQRVPPSPVRRGPGWEIGDDSGANHVAFYWRTTLPVLKRVVEEDGAA
jgi:uncharacterized protein YndB with AHSA1/START domain